jgi:hypothetical protein
MKAATAGILWLIKLLYPKIRVGGHMYTRIEPIDDWTAHTFTATGAARC